MLGDPRVLLLDEPVNGLDPEGILWVRNLMKQLAGEGRTIFVSSHLMNEMAVTADHLIVIGTGQADRRLPAPREFIARSSEKSVLVRSPDADRLAELIAAEGGKAIAQEPSDGQAAALTVTGLEAPRIGELAAAAPDRAARADPAACLAGGGVHGADRGQRGVRRRREARRRGAAAASARPRGAAQ